MVKVLVFVSLFAIVFTLPTKDDLLSESGYGDTAVVESKIREVRAAPDGSVPQKVKDLLAAGGKGAYIHTYGDGEGDHNGYHRKSEEHGSDGYKHFDSYHKKDGDKYGYEKHTEYGQENKEKDDAGEYSGKYQDVEKRDAERNDDEEKGEESKKAYQVVEDIEDDDGSSSYQSADSGSHADYTENGDEEDSGHYTEGSGDGEESSHYTDSGSDDDDNGHYEESDGSSEHYTHGGSDDDGNEELGHYSEYSD